MVQYQLVVVLLRLLPEICQVYLPSVSWYEFLYFRSREHSQPIVIDNRPEATIKSLSLFFNTGVHFKSRHIVNITYPKNKNPLFISYIIII